MEYTKLLVFYFTIALYRYQTKHLGKLKTLFTSLGTSSGEIRICYIMRSLQGFHIKRKQRHCATSHHNKDIFAILLENNIKYVFPTFNLLETQGSLGLVSTMNRAHRPKA